MSESSSDLFREEAVEYFRSAQRREGNPLRRPPAWTRTIYWLLCLLLVAGLAYGFLARVHVYAKGVAVVRVSGRTDVTVTAAGVVTAVEVQPGERVAAGQPLARLHGAEEAAVLRSAETRFETALAQVLRNPGDRAAHDALASLRAEKDLAEQRLEERLVRAPHDGVVSDLRIRPGQAVTPGEMAVSIVPDGAELYIVAVLPGQYRPQLAPGTLLRLEMTGYAYAYSEVPIETVSDEVIGPSEIKRFLGPDIADAVPVAGAAVLVRARLPSRTFVVDGTEFRYFDGMPARAQVRVRSERAIVAMFPWLRVLLGESHG